MIFCTNWYLLYFIEIFRLKNQQIYVCFIYDMFLNPRAFYFYWIYRKRKRDLLSPWYIRCNKYVKACWTHSVTLPTSFAALRILASKCKPKTIIEAIVCFYPSTIVFIRVQILLLWWRRSEEPFLFRAFSYIQESVRKRKREDLFPFIYHGILGR